MIRILCCLGSVALTVLCVNSAKSQASWEWDNPVWCITAVDSSLPNTLTNSANILEIGRLPPDEGYGEEIRLRMIVARTDNNQVEVYCSLMDLSDLDEPGSFQVEAYIPSTRPNQWMRFTFNNRGVGEQDWIEPLPSNWVN